MPQDSAPLLIWSPRLKQPPNDRMYCAELLVPCDDLDLPIIELDEDGEVMDQVKQVCWSKHSGDQHIGPGQSLAGVAVGEGCKQLVPHLFVGCRRTRRPLGVMLRQRGDRAELGTLAVRGDRDLHEMEESWHALPLAGLALSRICPEIRNGIGNRGRLVWVFALHDGQRDSIDEEHHVKHDEGRSAVSRPVEPELSDDAQVVRSPVVPDDQLNFLIPAAVPVGQSGDQDSVEQEVGHRPVGLDQATLGMHPLGLGNQGCDDPVEALLVEPRRAIRSRIEPVHGGPEAVCQDLRLEVGPPGSGRVGGNTAPGCSVERLRPAKTSRQVSKERPLDQVPLRLGQS